jgi:hypothetical protein
MDVPYTLRSTNFMNEIRRFYIFTKERSDLSVVRREALFIQLLEIVHEFEANILIAIKDQNISTLYPNVTYDILSKHGFLPKKVTEDDSFVTEEIKEDQETVKSILPKRRGRKPKS